MLRQIWMTAGCMQIFALCAGEQTIAFAPETALSVNGVREIQPVTGMVCNGESRMKFVEESRALNIPATRLYLWVAAPGGKLSLDQRVEALLAKRSPEAIAEEFDRNLQVGKYRDGTTPTAQYWQREQLGAWNAVKNVTLHLANFHPRSRADFQPYAEYYINCIREIRKRYPNLEISRLMIFNEPNYEFPRNWDKSLSEGVRLFLDGYNYVKKEVERNVSGLNVIGPGLASSATMSWTGWNSWTIPFLRTAGTATEFNQQIYTNRFNDLLAWDSMLQAASLAIRGKGIPTVTTECNVDLTIRDKKWQEHRFHVDRVRDEASLLFGMMRYPDIFRLKTYFLYLYTCDIRDLHYRQPDGSVRPAPVYYVFRLCRLPRVGAAAGVALAAVFVWGATCGRTTLVVNRVTVQSERLPESFEGFRVAQFSDVHVGSMVNPERELRRLVDTLNALRPDLVVFCGDLVNIRASELDGRVREILAGLEAACGVYSVTGNHDVGTQADDCDYTYFSRYFGEARMAGQPWYGGSYADNRGHFDLIDAGGTRYVFVYLGYHVDKAGMAFVNETLAAYPDRVGVLCVHSYFDHDCTLTDQGELLYDAVVAKNPNLYLVLCGHRYNSACVPATFDDDGDGTAERTVLQMICNYQAAGHTGGDGYLRLLQVDERAGEIHIRTYSPLRDDFVYYDTPEHQAENYAFSPDGEQGSVAIPWPLADAADGA